MTAPIPIPATDADLTESLEWLRAFERTNGRPLRVLHVGNIADNAYINAKFLRAVGVEAHVLCCDYYHIMATPEWEDVELQHDHGDDFFPVFSAADLRGYIRPHWFISGPLALGAIQLEQLFSLPVTMSRRWFASFVIKAVSVSTRMFGGRIGYGVSLLLSEPRMLVYLILRRLRESIETSRLSGLSPVQAFCRGLARLHDRLVERLKSRSRDIERIFSDVFPDRPDRLRADDVLPFLLNTSKYKRIFRHYDVVQGYGTDPIHPLLAGKIPYLGFEHGTLRDFTMGAEPYHQLTALAYRQSNHTFITNGDCLTNAKRLNIGSYSPIIHPIDVEQHRRDYGSEIDDLRRELDGEVILFCPTRHDYSIKGTDRFIRALPLVKQKTGRRVRMVLVEWGRQVADSKAMLRELQCEDDVIWKKAMCRITTIKHMRASDVVFDQMVLPVFGSTAPQAIAAGVPVVGSYVASETRWLIPEPAPIMPAYTPEQVADAVVQAIDPQWLSDYRQRARQWTDAYHSPNVVTREHLRTYRRVLAETAVDASCRVDRQTGAASTSV